MKFRKFTLLFYFFFTCVVIAQTTIEFGPSRNAGQNSTRIENLLNQIRGNSSEGGIITFQAGIYDFNRPIIVNAANVTFRGVSVPNNRAPRTTWRNRTPDNMRPSFIILGSNNTRVNRNSGDVVFGTNNSNPVGTRNIAFEDLVINNDFRTHSRSNSTVINNNDSQGTRLTNVHVMRSDFKGIESSNSGALHGLIVEDSRFSEIFDICIFIMNRDSDQYGSRITSLRAPFSVTNTDFDDGAAVGIEIDCGNDFFVDRQSRSVDEQVLLGNRTVTAGGKRHAFPTNLENSIIEGNTFGRCRRWHIAGVQASNFRVVDNRMNGPGAFDSLNGQSRPENSNSSNFHFEQFTHDVIIERNVMVNNTSQRGNRITSSFISMSSNEGRQRLSNDPIIAVVPGVGGIPPRTAPQFNNTFLRGTAGCPLPQRTAPNNLTCRREFHSYGPRNIIIRQNSFSSNVRVNRVLDFRDAEGFRLENNNYLGNISNRPANSVNGLGNGVLIGNTITNAVVEIDRGESGNCNVVIREPQFRTIIDNNPRDVQGENDPVQIAENAELASCGNSNPIRGNGIRSNRASKNGISFVSNNSESEIYATPNPTQNSISIEGVKEGIIEIYSLNGNLLVTTKYVEGSSLDMSNLSSGLYLVKVNVEGVNKILRVVKR